MTTVVTSIDRAAAGFLRLRFVRAISASWVALFVLVAILMLVLSVALARPDEADKVASLAVVSVVALILIPVAGALVDTLPSRVMALFGLIASIVLLLLSLAVIAVALSDQLRAASMTDYDAVQNWIGITVVALSLPIFAEGVGWSWWQLNASRAEFLAARGWQPSTWRMFSALRVRMGLPAFISNFGRGRMGLTVIYFLIAILNLGLVAFIFAPAVASYIPRNNTLLTPFFIVGGFLALPLLNVLGAGALLQRQASRRATKLYQDARKWDARPPIVFLRAFDQDTLKLEALANDPIVKLPAGCGEARTMDEILLEHASPYGPVIAIGDPRNPVPPLGAARIYVPDAGSGWQHIVSSLVQNANAVVMCPNASEGVKWEIDLLAAAEGRVRVIYIANPELSGPDNMALFARLGDLPPLGRNQQPIAAFREPQMGWRILTTTRPPCVQTYTVALNTALQALLGAKGTPLKRPRRLPAEARA